MMKLLIDNGADLNVVDNFKASALIRAVSKSNPVPFRKNRL